MNIIKLFYKLDNVGIIIKMCLTWYHKSIYVLIFMCLFNTTAIADNLHLRNILVGSTIIATTNFGSPITLSPGQEITAHSFSHGDVDTVEFYKGTVATDDFICKLTVEENEYKWYLPGMKGVYVSNYQPKVYLPWNAQPPCVYRSSFPQSNWIDPVTFPAAAPFSYVTIYPAPFKP